MKIFKIINKFLINLNKKKLRSLNQKKIIYDEIFKNANEIPLYCLKEYQYICCEIIELEIYLKDRL